MFTFASVNSDLKASDGKLVCAKKKNCLTYWGPDSCKYCLSPVIFNIFTWILLSGFTWLCKSPCERVYFPAVCIHNVMVCVWAGSSFLSRGSFHRTVPPLWAGIHSFHHLPVWMLSYCKCSFSSIMPHQNLEHWSWRMCAALHFVFKNVYMCHKAKRRIKSWSGL